MDIEEKTSFRPIKVIDLVTVLLRSMELKIYAGVDGLSNLITGPRIQKPGLAYNDFLEFIDANRVQVLGTAEICYWESLGNKKDEAITQFCNKNLSCIVLTEGTRPFQKLISECESHNTTLLVSKTDTSTTIEEINRQLRILMAPEKTIHGVLLEIFGLGVMIIGTPGIGKSESALDLINRGHRLIADDIVLMKKLESDVIVGYAPEIITNLMEIRGLGIINIKDLFGMSSVRTQIPIELIIELKKWEDGLEYDRLGIREDKYNILETAIPSVTIPVAPGRNLSILIETATRSHLVKQKYGSSFTEFERKMHKEMIKRAKIDNEADS